METRVLQSFALFFCLLIAASMHAQCPINSLGQNPSTAFPVCGTGTFKQDSVNLCGGRSIPNPKCNTNVLSDVNPYYYKFTCFKSGTLGFSIEPNSDVSDYDWQVFDVTDRDVNDIYVDRSMSIASNWSQYFGITGTTATGGNLFECEGPTPKLSKMPTITEGHDYILLVSHFSNTQAGYKLSFLGGTASITDTSLPRLSYSDAFCDGTRIGVKLSKKMKCGSLSPNGSEFYLKGTNAKVISANGPYCTTGFDLDSVELKLDQPLPVGTYFLFIKRGTDGNTLVDICDRELPAGDSLAVVILPNLPTPLGNVLPVSCKPDSLRIFFAKNMLCNTIAPDGSDFTITGPSAVTVVAARGSACNNGVSKGVTIQLSRPITVGGTYTVSLKRGSDGNTIINECGKETPEASVSFTAYDTVDATIAYTISSSCLDDTLKLSNSGQVNINSWTWSMDDGSRANTQSLQRVFSSGIKTFRLLVSNGYCRDSSVATINFDKNRLKASFDAPRFVCPLDTAFFTDLSTGPVTGWYWNFGNGQSSVLQQAPYQFYPVRIELQKFTTYLVIEDIKGCKDTAYKTIEVPGNCYIAVPSAFTPNGDGLNDFLYPLSAYKAEHLVFKVYNRYGQLVWQTTDWTKKWDGRFNGELQQSGIYVWQLNYYDPDTKKNVDIKGTTTLIR